MVLLEADLDMKKHVAQLIHPDSELGDRFWHTFYSRCGLPLWVRVRSDIGERRFPSDEPKCFSFRQWIVPGNVSVCVFVRPFQFPNFCPF
jgi:hypothetical protein